MRYLAQVALASSVCMLGCKPDFAERPSDVQNYRILAIQAEPAEWQSVIDPNTGVAKPATYRALVASPIGTIGNAALDWAFCTLPKPLTELNDVNVGCFQNDPKTIVAIGGGPLARAPVPDNACRQFGPDIPEDQSFRPADPDVTGGYYQPLRVIYRPVPGQLIPSIGKVRIRCGLPGASQEQVTQYNRSYHLNTNPRIDAVEALLPNGPSRIEALEADANAAPFVLAAGEVVTMRATWPACPTTDRCGDGTCGPTETKEKGAGQCDPDCKTEIACGGAERYLAFDLESRLLVESRETMRASWFVADGGGTFHDDRTGRDGADLTTTTENEYTAPTKPGTYPLWVVLRDDRGGVTWSSLRVHVD